MIKLQKNQYVCFFDGINGRETAKLFWRLKVDQHFTQMHIVSFPTLLGLIHTICLVLVEERCHNVTTTQTRDTFLKISHIGYQCVKYTRT